MLSSGKNGCRVLFFFYCHLVLLCPPHPLNHHTVHVLKSLQVSLCLASVSVSILIKEMVLRKPRVLQQHLGIYFPVKSLPCHSKNPLLAVQLLKCLQFPDSFNDSSNWWPSLTFTPSSSLANTKFPGLSAVTLKITTAVSTLLIE